jgi:hypothetical protein
MARLHGRAGRLYMNLTSGGTAEPVAYLNTWEITAATDDVEVTAFGDANKVYVSGLPDVGGSFSGFYDDASVQTYTAATDGVPRKFYLYPNTGTNTQYWFGTAAFDFSASGGVDSAVTVSGNWKAASLISKVG